jgi:hypothetical protein
MSIRSAYPEIEAAEIPRPGLVPERTGERGAAVPLMGPADPDTATGLMGPADPGTSIPVMGPADRGDVIPLMGPADPGTAAPLMSARR